MNNVNDGLPSAADSLGKEMKSTSRQVEDAVTAAEEFASDMTRRGAEAYESGNAAVAAYVPPLPGLLLAAAAGFAAGCLWSSGRR